MHADYYVYILFRNNGIPFYVGKGRGERWLKHEQKRTRHNPYLQHVLKQENYCFPKVKLHENLTEKEAHAVEMLFITAIGRVVDGQGPLVNATLGGEGQSGKVWTVEQRAKASVSGKLRFEDPEQLRKHRERDCWSEEFKEKRRQAMLVMWQNIAFREQIQKFQRGRKLPQEHRENIKIAMNTPEQKERARKAATGRVPSEQQKQKQSIALKGRKLSPEHCAKISAARKGKPVIEKGTKLSPEHCAAISAGLKAKGHRPWLGRKLTDEHKANLSIARRRTVARKFAEAEGWGMRA